MVLICDCETQSWHINLPKTAAFTNHFEENYEVRDGQAGRVFEAPPGACVQRDPHALAERKLGGFGCQQMGRQFRECGQGR